MSVVLVTETQSPSLASYCARYASNCSAQSKPPDACKTHLNSTACKGHHLGVKEGLFPKEQQPWAAACISSMQQQHATAACNSSMQQQHQADRRQHQQHKPKTPGNAAARSAAQLGGDAGPAHKKELR